MSWLGLGSLGGGLGQSLGQVGGSLSSLSGQISSLTKDLLTEGTEERGDASTELQLTKARLQELQATCTTQKSEHERLRAMCAELEDKKEAAELHVQHVSAEYRTQLQQKEVEVSLLRTRQNALQEQLRELQYAQDGWKGMGNQEGTQSSTPSASSAASTGQLHFRTSVAHGFRTDDEVDYEEVIFSERELDRLSREVVRLQTEADHWRQLAQAAVGEEPGSSENNEVHKLQTMVKELKRQLTSELDERQREVSALQDAHRQQLAQAAHAHRAHTTEQADHIAQLQQQLQLLQEPSCDILQTTAENSRAASLLHTEQEIEDAGTGPCISDNAASGAQNDEASHDAPSRMRQGFADESMELKKTKVTVRDAGSQCEGNSLGDAMVRQEVEEGPNEAEGPTWQRSAADLQTLTVLLQEREQELGHTMTHRDSLLSQLEELDRQNQEATQHIVMLRQQLKEHRQEADLMSTQHQEQLRTLELQLTEASAALARGDDTDGSHASSTSFLLVKSEATVEGLADVDLQENCSDMEPKGICGEELPLEAFSQKTQMHSHEMEMFALSGCEELEQLKEEITNIRLLNEQLQIELNDMRIVRQELEQRLAAAEAELKETDRQLGDAKTSKDEMTKNMSFDKTQVDAELRQAENKLETQRKQYELTIQQLTDECATETSVLKTENERVLKLIQEKEMDNSSLEHNVERLQGELKESKEMLLSKVQEQTSLMKLMFEKDEKIQELQNYFTAFKEELEIRCKAIQDTDAAALRLSLEEKENQLSTLKEENSHLKEEIDHLQPTVDPKTVDIISEQETEIAELMEKIRGVEAERVFQKQLTEQQNVKIVQMQKTIQQQESHLSEAKTQQEQTISASQKLISEKDNEIVHLQEVLASIQSPCSNEIIDRVNVPVFLKENGNKQQAESQESEKQDLSKVEVEHLLRSLNDKEIEVNSLNQRNNSLVEELKQMTFLQEEVGKLAQLLKHREQEIQHLHTRALECGPQGSSMGSGVEATAQHQVQALMSEREHILMVLNEKARENAQLRTEQHQLVDMMAAKENSLQSLMEENRRLADELAQNSGSYDMSREAIQNLSRLVREKDIEIDALSQKCQTLLAVLQASNEHSPCIPAERDGSPIEQQQKPHMEGLVSGAQFEEVLQEREQLRQQVKKVEEWKQQALTSVQNMQHESAHLQDELRKLAGQVAKDAGLGFHLQEGYDGLLQGYQQHVHSLQSLREDLGKVQLGLCSLQATGNRITEKIQNTSFDNQTNLNVSETHNSDVDNTGNMNIDNLKLLHLEEQNTVPTNEQHATQPGKAPAADWSSQPEEVQNLRKILEEKDVNLQKLQEHNNQLLNNLSDLSKSEKKMCQSDHGANHEQTENIMKKSEELLKLLQEKDTTIKRQCEDIAAAAEKQRTWNSENELLRQAVINLKERTRLLEADLAQLKEEKEQVSQHAQGQNSELGALQQSAMQLSMLLREKEFETSSAKEKAAALEKLLREKDTGSAGELETLLAELKRQQEQAVAFQHERDQSLLALKQKQMENMALTRDLERVAELELRIRQDAERLRAHLVQVEEAHTLEDLAGQEREASLSHEVTVLRGKLNAAYSASESTSYEASMRADMLQEQLRAVSLQRDTAVQQCNAARQQAQQYAASLSNLQTVLEQFQQEEKSMYATELEKHRREAQSNLQKANQMQQQVKQLQERLDEANNALESASRLTEQLDLKDARIEELQRQVLLQQEMLEEVQTKMMNLLNSSEGKVDKVLLRNILVGYFSTPKNKRVEVLKLMGVVLGVKREDMDKLVSDEQVTVTKWVSSWLGGGSSHNHPAASHKSHNLEMNSSFSEMFLKFLETESLPSPPPPKMPLAGLQTYENDKASRIPGPGLARRPEIMNPIMVARSSAVPLAGASQAGLHPLSSHLLMKPISDTLPTFTPLPVSTDASSEVLFKDLLK
ncbi:LOW QUALITY PROTEIN: thyroid receptor-interacting protein 11-like [Lethenteron reissneri]|uniref:LOW QUALITY PROTEIN: thyroid receptor-interacting protein 11-like n=1 Tax=Lethenteron reissneri TaxID=7753 RepID=UPI002AB66BC7|nr:LOW QUALITY PROTEIN: thyroid receptor-interacting protein 11-like [Lethenteron reissneri]